MEDSSEAYRHSPSCGLGRCAALQGQMGFGRAERNGLLDQTYWKLLGVHWEVQSTSHQWEVTRGGYQSSVSEWSKC